MKKYILQIFLVSILFFIFIYLLTAQYPPNGTIKLFVQDSNGRIDSVTFGIKDLSTVGIDKSFGESNIYGTPNDSLDIRVIQRDSLNHNCSYFGVFFDPPKVGMYYPENIDSKIDFRPYNFDNYLYLDNINMNFEINVNAVNYPVFVKADLSNFINTWYPYYTHIFSVDTNCNNQKDIFIPNINKMDSMFVLNNNSIQTLIVKFYHEFSVKDFKPIEPNWEIFPNPANQTVNINGVFLFNGKIDIVDLSGKVLKSLDVINQESVSLNISSIPKGFYLIRYLDESKEEISVRKLIIE